MLFQKKINYLSHEDSIVIFLLSLSVFFSFIKINYIEFRFLYLLSFFFLFIKNRFFFFTKATFLFLLILLTIYLYSIFNFFILNKEIFIHNDKYNYFSIVKLFFSRRIIEVFVIFLTILYVYHYKELIKSNIFKFINIFLVLFFIFICGFALKYPIFFFKNLINCNTGFFAESSYLFLENSHFHIISVPIIFFFFFNISKFFKRIFIIIPCLFFLIFSVINNSTTYFISLFLGTIISLFFFKDLKIKIKIIIGIFLIINFFILSSQKTCASDDGKYISDYKVKIEKKFIGNIMSPKDKIIDGFIKIFNKKDYINERINLSASVYYGSIIKSLDYFIKYPFGIGLNNFYLSKYENFFNLNIEKFFATGFKTLNNSDGSFLLPKLIVEFGIFAIFYLLFLAYYFLRIGANIDYNIFIMHILLTQTLVRSAGYFNSGFLIFFLLLIFDRINSPNN